jgi:hypothetical protein
MDMTTKTEKSKTNANANRLAFPLPGVPGGLTKRELIASMVLQGVEARSFRSDLNGPMPAENAVGRALVLTDELIKQLAVPTAR